MTFNANNTGGGGGGGNNGNVLTWGISGYLSVYVAPFIFEFTAPHAIKYISETYGEDYVGAAYLAHGVATLLVTCGVIHSTMKAAVALVLTATARYGAYGLGAV